MELLIHSVWAVACLIFILLSLYLAFGIEQRKELFTGLSKGDYTRLNNIATKATAGSFDKISFDVAVGSDLQSIWVASNRKGPAGLFLSLKSIWTKNRSREVYFVIAQNLYLICKTL